MLWYILKQLFPSVSVATGRYNSLIIGLSKTSPLKDRIQFWNNIIALFSEVLKAALNIPSRSVSTRESSAKKLIYMNKISL